ncbi:MAG: SPASM domain-containing protein [Bacteroidales bacterium]|nr:SPASM domain-containing protein [Bacteroidales bacterium]
MKRVTGFSVNPSLPPAISVELSSRCNLACPECVTGAGLLQRKNEFISFSLAGKIAAELRGHTISAWLCFQGEPMMHPRFFDIVDLFGEMNPVISTNGHYLSEEVCLRLTASPLRKIIISYDGISPEVYNIYRRGGNHELVTEGISRLTTIIRERGSRLVAELQFLLHRGNEHEASAAAELASSLGAGFRIKSMQVLDNKRAGEWMPAGIGKSRYIMSGGEWKLTGIGKSRYIMSEGEWKKAAIPSRGCLRMWTTAVITADGDVVPCCYDKNAGHVMGNLNERTFRDIWHGKQYNSFRDTVMKSRRLIDICRDCPQGSRIFFRR